MTSIRQSYDLQASGKPLPSLLLTVAEASDWATRATGRRVESGNIMYLVNYGRVRNAGENGRVMIPLDELEAYYQSKASREGAVRHVRDDGLNWRLSFDEYRESERTKHVHRLHPYKGKFIPQLVEYFLTADARHVDWATALGVANPELLAKVAAGDIKGIFTSPPYVGLIDYHEQHAYAYELLGFTRRDESEIGPMSNGQSRAARDAYVSGVSDALINSRRVLSPDCNIFVVANDKFGLYGEIASRSGLQIVNQYHRPVLHRTEKDRSPYSETIFHMRLQGA